MRKKGAILAKAFALSPLFLSCHASFANTVNVNGQLYNFQTIYGTGPGNLNLLQSQPWWGNFSLSSDFASSWSLSNSATSERISFAYEYDSSLGYTRYWYGNSSGYGYSGFFDNESGTFAYVVPLPSKTSSVKSSGGKTVVSTGSGISKNTGKAAGGKLTYLATTTNKSSSTFVDLTSVFAALSSLNSSSDVDAAWEQLTAEPYASNLSVGLESMNRFRKNALAIALADNKISYTKTKRVKVCQDENGKSSTTALNPGQKLSKDETNCAITKVKKTLPWSLVIDGTNTQASLRGTEDLGSLDYNIFQSTYGVEYALNNQFSIGGVFGYGQNNLYNYEFADTRVNSDTYSGGLYGLYKPSEPATIALLGGYSRFNTDSRRPIQFGTINRLAEADWNSNGYMVALSGEYAFTLNKGTGSADPKQKEKESRNAILLKPNALVSFAGYSQGLIEESGAQSLNLKLNPHTATSVIFGGGLVLQAPIVVSSESRLIPRLGVGYRYDVNGNSDEEHEVTGGFVDLPEAGEIDVYGQNRGSNDVDVSLGLEYEISSNTAIYSNVAGSFWSNGNELTYGGGFRYSW